MEVSPLPHKAPFVVETQIEPTPLETIIADASPAMDTTQDLVSDLMKQSGIQE